jgi:hypothetical protein
MQKVKTFQMGIYDNKGQSNDLSEFDLQVNEWIGEKKVINVSICSDPDYRLYYTVLYEE